MKLASYHGTRPGIMGIGNIVIRLRLRGQFSHSEIVFMPGDGVDHLMPDGTCEPVDGAYWCVSSTGLEHVPEWSVRRPGKMGGVRFKRIVLDPARWTQTDLAADPVYAAEWAKVNEGRLYDWQLIFGFVSWFIPNKDSRVMCSEVCAVMCQIPDAWRFDPCAMHSLAVGLNQAKVLSQNHFAKT